MGLVKLQESYATEFRITFPFLINVYIWFIFQLAIARRSCKLSCHPLEAGMLSWRRANLWRSWFWLTLFIQGASASPPVFSAPRISCRNLISISYRALLQQTSLVASGHPAHQWFCLFSFPVTLPWLLERGSYRSKRNRLWRPRFYARALLSSYTECALELELELMEFHWSGLPFPTPEHLPNPGMEAVSLVSPALAGGSFTTEPSRKFDNVIKDENNDMSSLGMLAILSI